MDSSGRSSSSAAGPSSQDASFSTLQWKFANATMRTLKKNKNAGPFSVPVDPIALGIPHYTTIVTNPMDFATIERKLFVTVPTQVSKSTMEDDASAGYRSADEWVKDVYLVFKNSYAFNGPDHPISKMALALEAVFVKQVKRMPSRDEVAPTVSIPGRDGMNNGPGSASTPDDDPYRSQTNTPYLQSNTALPAVTPRAATADLVTEQLKFCAKVLDHLYKPEFQTFAWFFYDPVKETDLPGYHAVIKHPMSLAVMRTKLDSGQYPDPSAFRADFDLIIANCNTWNRPGTVAQASAKQLKDLFEKKWKALQKLRGASATKSVIPSSAARSSSAIAEKPPVLSIPASRRSSVVATTPKDSPVATASVPLPLVPLPASPAHHNNPPRQTTMPPPPRPTQPLASPVAKPLPPRLNLPLPPPPMPSLPAKAPHLSLPVPSQSTPRKRKSEEQLQPADEANHDPHLTPREQDRLVRAIDRLKGAQLKLAVDMIKEEIGNTPSCSKRDEAEYEVSAMPYTLVKSLYIKFVGPLQRANKRPKRAAAAAGELRMDISDSD